MIKSVASLICCVLAAGGFGLLRHTPPDRSHDDWLQERYFEATSIKEGMTRADLKKLFVTDGGLQPVGIPTRYVLKSSRMIKVDVEFDVPNSMKGKIVPEDEVEIPVGAPNRKPSQLDYQVVPNKQLKIKSISRPYLEQFTLD